MTRPERTYRAAVRVARVGLRALGMTVEANIVLRETDDAVLIPPAAVRDGRVFVVRQETVESRPVELGVQGARAVEVLRGITRGEAVVLDPPAGLASGQAIRLRP